MNFDVLIIGAGPSGLSAGIRLAQLAKKNNKEFTKYLIKKNDFIFSLKLILKNLKISRLKNLSLLYFLVLAIF